MNPLRHPYRWSIGLVVFIILFAFSLPGGGIQERGSEILSVSYMKRIAGMVELYQADNEGKLPVRLSALVATYGGPTNFFFPRFPNDHTYRPPSDNHDPRLIDLFSVYDLAPLADGRAVIFERKVVWSDGKMNYCLTDKGTENAGNSQTGHVSPDAFRTLFLRDFKP